jgi:hypothetical protein
MWLDGPEFDFSPVLNSSPKAGMPALLGSARKKLAQQCEKVYINQVAAILLIRAAASFDPGSGTPKPHTSTATVSLWIFQWSDFSPGKLHSGDLHEVAGTHAPLHFVTA